MLEGKRVTVISSLRSLGVKGVWEEVYDVTRFRRSLQPTENRKKLLMEFYAHDATSKITKVDVEFGGRLHTVAVTDIAEII